MQMNNSFNMNAWGTLCHLPWFWPQLLFVLWKAISEWFVSFWKQFFFYCCCWVEIPWRIYNGKNKNKNPFVQALLGLDNLSVRFFRYLQGDAETVKLLRHSKCGSAKFGVFDLKTGSNLHSDTGWRMANDIILQPAIQFWSEIFATNISQGSCRWFVVS